MANKDKTTQLKASNAFIP